LELLVSGTNAVSKKSYQVIRIERREKLGSRRKEGFGKSLSKKWRQGAATLTTLVVRISSRTLGTPPRRL
jgi:hypothetical protein